MHWILFTLFAAFMQAWRNAFQSKLSKEVKVLGVTLARFIWASPIAATYLILLYIWKPIGLPNFNLTFFFFVIAASCMQILATGLMVKLFKLNNFAIGAGLAKSEALMAAILGMFFFGTDLSLLGWIGVLIGALAVFLMSSRNGLKELSWKTVLLGISCGTSFALTSLWIREASQSLDFPKFHSAAWVLFLVISVQTIILVTYLFITDKETLKDLMKRPRLTILISFSSCLGSMGWFTAMSLKAVPYVKTLGQVEVFFMMFISIFWLKEKVHKKDFWALILIALSAILVMIH